MPINSRENDPPNLKRSSHGPLRDRFLVPPFSVLNTRDGEWQRRKRKWLSLGIESEVGRDVEAYSQKGLNAANIRAGRRTSNSSGTSIFDPVLTEICYKWWCPAGGTVVDPFAGGSVRGIVASILGLEYWGCELRSEQVAANNRQLTEDTCGAFKPTWTCGDSSHKLPDAPRADFILSSPPYGDLEKYSDDPSDLSSMSHEDFLTKYFDIITKTCDRLRQDRFAVFVVANYRDGRSGLMQNLVGETITGFKACDVKLYNDIVFMTPVGTAALRANTSFIRGARKVMKIHQNVLVFVKGDPKKASECIGARSDMRREHSTSTKERT